MVVAAHPLAARAADEALAEGGTAVDAAIVAQMVLNLVEPQSSGIGGGGFMLVRVADGGRLRIFDGREEAPAAATPDRFLGADGERLPFFDAVDSGLSVGVPGLLRMLDLAHRAGGRLAWERLFEPAIALAENGFAVSGRLHQSIASARERIVAQPAARAYFLNEAGEPWPVGHILRNPALALTLKRIASDGPDAFYRGPVAESIVAAVNGHPTRPGQMTLDDLERYRAVERDPLCGAYRGVRVCGMPPPSSGALTLLQVLGILERFDVSALEPGSASAVHLISEAYRLAYADRARYIADPAFVDVPVDGMLADDYLARRAALIDEAKTLGKAPAGEPEGAPRAGADETRPLPGTTHLSIVDAEGNAVSMTTSIEHAFGSLQMAGGFLLNNQLTDFSFHPVDRDGQLIANRVEPGKRPRSSMAPTMVLDDKGRLEAVLGSPGGSAIIQYVCQTLIATIDWKLDIQQAVEMPHFGATTSARTSVESQTTLSAVTEALEARGHEVRERPMTSGLHAIVAGRRADGSVGRLAGPDPRDRWLAGVDPRREGLAIGR